MQEENWLNDYVLTVNELLSPQECDNYIRMSEDIGFEDALVTIGEDTGDGSAMSSRAVSQQRRADVRNNQRVTFRSEEVADFLWQRAVDFVPCQWDGRGVVGLNELLRFYRYDIGQQFNWHQDFPYERDSGEKSYWTFMVYLNDDFAGGETSFEDSYSDEAFDDLKVTPRKGMGLFFEHSVHHKGEPVLDGRKYVLRTDVMYAPEDDDSGGDDDEDDEY